jgi:hypothetical protein
MKGTIDARQPFTASSTCSFVVFVRHEARFAQLGAGDVLA